MNTQNGKVLNDGMAIGLGAFIEAGRCELGTIDDELGIIVVAKRLSLSATLQFYDYKIVGIVVEEETMNSHVSILARIMNIPLITGIKVSEEWENEKMIIDGHNGTVCVSPGDMQLKLFSESARQYAELKDSLQEYAGLETITRQGKNVKLCANITSINDVDCAVENGAEGIGNFKTEFIFLTSNDFPGEEQQFNIYKQLALSMEGKKTIIRTIDIGADKTVEYLGLEREDNPALGYRAIRYCLDHEDVFKTQIRAILRASAFGNVGIMFPMISSCQEIIRIRQIVESVMHELRHDGVAFDENIEQGIMIETPAAVLISDILAEQVDFFSIGTNDLTQYMLAVDRYNPKLEKYNDTHHPAIIRAIKCVVRAAHAADIWVSLSGELAQDYTITKELVEAELDMLAIPPKTILPMRKFIRNI